MVVFAQILRNFAQMVFHSFSGNCLLYFIQKPVKLSSNQLTGFGSMETLILGKLRKTNFQSNFRWLILNIKRIHGERKPVLIPQKGLKNNSYTHR